jgi:hypothetical protein
MSAQRPASPELDADDVTDARCPNTARIWNYQLGGKDNFPVDRKASDAANAMVRESSRFRPTRRPRSRAARRRACEW